MAQHIVSAPDGSQHVIEAPDGATPEQITAFAAQTIPQPPGGKLTSPAMLDPSTQQPPVPKEWGDVVGDAVTNLPSSAMKIGTDIAHSVAHPVETAQGLYGVGKGAASEAGITAPDPDSQAKFDAVKDFYKQRYGSMEGFKSALSKDPAGVLMDVSTALTGGETALARLPGVVGKLGDISGQAARLTNPISLAAKAVPAAGKLASQGLGLTTGVAPESIQEVAKAGYRGSTAAVDNMRGTADPNHVVDMADNALKQMAAQRGAEYNATMSGVRSNTTPLKFGPIRQAVTDGYDMAHFRDTPKDANAAQVVQDIRDKVDHWETSSVADPAFRTAVGMDALKQTIGEIRQGTEQGTLARKVSDSVYQAVRNQIAKQDPAYAVAMGKYSDASDQISEIRNALRVKDTATYDSGLRALTSSMRNNVNTNYGARAKSLQQLAQHEPDLPAAVSGQAMNSWLPRGILRSIIPATPLAAHGISALADPATLAALPLFSPRVVGEAAHAAGKVAGYVVPPRAAGLAGKGVNALSRAAKAGYLTNALSGQNAR